jgi:peptidoglycan L-alanyl-D-glutamate endopeptidase CwlK
MTQEEYKLIEEDFLLRVDKVRLEAYQATGYEWIVVPRTGAFRSIKEQHGLYIQAHDGIDNDHDGKIDEADEKITNADGGQSPHNFDLARDITPCRTKNDPWWTAPASIWAIMGTIASQNGLTWGGTFKKLYDAPHIEDKKWKEIQAAWKAGKLVLA